MSTLVSSVVIGGRKAAPKAVARRRPPPVPVKPKAPTRLPAAAESDAQDSADRQSESQEPRDTPDSLQPLQRVDLSPQPPEIVVRSSPRVSQSTEPSDLHSRTSIVQQSEPRSTRQTVVRLPEVHVNGSDKEHVQSDNTESHAAPSTVISHKRRNESDKDDVNGLPAKRTKRAPTRKATRSAEDAHVENGPRERTTPVTTPRDHESNSIVVEAPAQPSSKVKSQRKAVKANVSSRSLRSNATQPTSTNGDITEDLNSQPTNEIQGQQQEQEQTGERRQAVGRKRRRRTRAVQAGSGGEAVPNGAADADDADGNNEDDIAESHVIDPASLTMYDLSKDSKHGKRSEREKKMAEIDWDEVARRRRAAADPTTDEQHPQPKGVIESTEGPDGTAEPRAQEQTPAPPSGSGSGVKFRIVDGQIVVDESTTTIDRQAQAEAEAQANEPVQEETDLTTRINRTTWINDRRRDVADRVPMHKGKSDPWTFDETERLYQAIAMFGTDYFTIAQMFPPKTRKQIKLKVQREEKIDPIRINAAFLGQHTPMTLEFYAEATGRDVSDFTKHGTLEQASTRIAEDMKDKEEAMHAALAQEAENEKNREAFEKEQARAKNSKKKAPNDKKPKKRAQEGGTMDGVPYEQAGELLDPDD